MAYILLFMTYKLTKLPSYIILLQAYPRTRSFPKCECDLYCSWKYLGAEVEPIEYWPHNPSVRGYDDNLNEIPLHFVHNHHRKKGLCAPRRLISHSGCSALSGKSPCQRHCINMVSGTQKRHSSSHLSSFTHKVDIAELGIHGFICCDPADSFLLLLWVHGNVSLAC